MTRRRTSLVIASLLMAVGAAPALASTPADSGTVTAPSAAGMVMAAWTGTVSGADANGSCTGNVTTAANDDHTYTVAYPASLPAGATVTMTVTETATAADTILELTKDGKSLNVSDNSSVGGSETLTMVNPPAGQYDAITCAYAGASPYSATVTLTTAVPVTGGTVGGTSTTAGPTTWGNYPLTDVPATNAAGEPSIGINWGTGDVYYQASLTTVRAVFPSTYNLADKPKVSDVTCLATSVTSLDAIGYVDPETGRVGAGQLIANPAGINSITNFFDDTTTAPTAPQTTCMPSTGGGVIAGPDHETLGGGVYPKPLPTGVLGPTTAYPDAFYYCSQAIEASFCGRSDDGGTTFTGDSAATASPIDGCGGLHGHVRVGPEGNVYLPNKACNGTAGLAVSTDAGTTFTVYPVTGSTSGSTDPSVAADRAGRVYFGYTGSDGLPGITTSTDGGKTWGPIVDPAEAVGVKRAVWAETIAGDDGRAAFAFMGSTTPGNSDDAAYGEDATGTNYTGGDWNVYVATTVDGGKTYKTEQVTTTPTQRGSICTAGTTCMGSTRNLLDFMDITVDKTGHVLVAYAIGCTGACVTSTKVTDNPFNAQGAIARQLTGPLLFATSATGTTAVTVPAAPGAPAAPGTPAAPGAVAAPTGSTSLASTGLDWGIPALALLALVGAMVPRRHRKS